jgi:hypothetical protein
VSLEEKIVKYVQIQEQIKALEEVKQQIYQEILGSFHLDSQEIFSESYRVKRHFRINIKTTVEEARPFQAIKTEEVVDKDKIKELLHSGVLVPNVTETSYFFIHKL